ncbi:MAG: M48 family metalloprotease, partial [Pseudanabaenaceae cyanobacterium]
MAKLRFFSYIRGLRHQVRRLFLFMMGVMLIVGTALDWTALDGNSLSWDSISGNRAAFAIGDSSAATNQPLKNPPYRHKPEYWFTQWSASNRRDALLLGDQLWAAGKKAEAQRQYRRAKLGPEPVPNGNDAGAMANPKPVNNQGNATGSAAPKLPPKPNSLNLNQLEPLPNSSESVLDISEMSGSARVYWREAQAGLAAKLETRTLVPLRFLIQEHPRFVPAYGILYQELKRYGYHDEAKTVLAQAVARHPNQPPVVEIQVLDLAEQQKWLDASLMARRFAVLYPQRPEAARFTELANQYLQRYQDDLRAQVTNNAIANFLVGAAAYTVTGSLYGPISAVQTTSMVLEGESALGERFSRMVNEHLPVITEPDTVAYIKEVGQKLATVAGRNEFNYEFTVLDSPQLNAFALPGGKIFINAGAILQAQSEAEIAGLLAHELSHAVLSHGFQLMTQGSVISNLFQVIPLGGIAADLVNLNYSREMEQQADLVGTRILVSAGYAADGLRNLMQTLANNRTGKTPQPPVWLSTHPDTQDRVRVMDANIDQEKLERYTYEGIERHEAIKEKLQYLVHISEDPESN